MTEEREKGIITAILWLLLITAIFTVGYVTGQNQESISKGKNIFIGEDVYSCAKKEIK